MAAMIASQAEIMNANSTNQKQIKTKIKFFKVRKPVGLVVDKTDVQSRPWQQDKYKYHIVHDIYRRMKNKGKMRLRSLLRSIMTDCVIALAVRSSDKTILSVRILYH